MELILEEHPSAIHISQRFNVTSLIIKTREAFDLFDYFSNITHITIDNGNNLFYSGPYNIFNDNIETFTFIYNGKENVYITTFFAKMKFAEVICPNSKELAVGLALTETVHLSIKECVNVNKLSLSYQINLDTIELPLAGSKIQTLYICLSKLNNFNFLQRFQEITSLYLEGIKGDIKEFIYTNPMIINMVISRFSIDNNESTVILILPNCRKFLSSGITENYNYQLNDVPLYKKEGTSYISWTFDN